MGLPNAMPVLRVELAASGAGTRGVIPNFRYSSYTLPDYMTPCVRCCLARRVRHSCHHGQPAWVVRWLLYVYVLATTHVV